MAKIIPFKNGTLKDTISVKAAGLFKGKGFNATSMKDIADAMGVQAPSLYNHINSKKDILREICFKIAKQFTANLNEAEASAFSASKKTELIIRFHIRMMLKNHEDVYVSEHEWKHLAEPYLANFKTQRKNYRTRFANIIQQGILNKELNNIDPSVAVLSILSAINGIEYWHLSRKMIDATSLEENMVKMLLEGIQK